jgi:hypothetical protein
MDGPAGPKCIPGPGIMLYGNDGVYPCSQWIGISRRDENVVNPYRRKGLWTHGKLHPACRKLEAGITERSTDAKYAVTLSDHAHAPGLNLSIHSGR